MYRIIIVDDFNADRIRLKELVNSLQDIDINIIGEYKNGLEVIEAVKISEPDIIISDIEMPVMTGFEMAKALKKDFPNISIIFCSLYNEFEYAKEAIYLDSCGYILKPVDPKELKDCIIKVMGKINCEYQKTKEYDNLKEILNENMSVLAESFIKNLVYGINKEDIDIWDKIKFFNLNITPGYFVLSLLEIYDFENIVSELSIERRQILSLKVYERVKSILNLYYNNYVLKLDDSHFLSIHSFEIYKVNNEINNEVTQICNSILNTFEKSDISLSIAISSECNDIINIDKLYEQCCYLIKHKFLLGKGKIIFSDDVPSSVSDPEVDFSSMQKSIRFLLNSGNNEEITVYITKLFDSSPVNAGEAYYKNLCFGIVVCIQMVLFENNEDFKSVFNGEYLVWNKLLQFEIILHIQ